MVTPQVIAVIVVLRASREGYPLPPAGRRSCGWSGSRGQLGLETVMPWESTPSAGLPGPQVRPPAGDRSPVGFVLLAELLKQRRLLVEEDPQAEEQADGPGVEEEPELAQQQRLPGDGDQQRYVYGVADVTVETADHQVPGGGDRRRRAQALDHEANERMHDRAHPRQQ